MGDIDPLVKRTFIKLPLPLGVGLSKQFFFLRLAAVSASGEILDSVRLDRPTTLGYEYGDIFDQRKFTVFPNKPMRFLLNQSDKSFSLEIPSLISNDFLEIAVIYRFGLRPLAVL